MATKIKWHLGKDMVRFLTITFAHWHCAPGVLYGTWFGFIVMFLVPLWQGPRCFGYT